VTPLHFIGLALFWIVVSNLVALAFGLAVIVPLWLLNAP
jgi:hypothetical protein